MYCCIVNVFIFSFWWLKVKDILRVTRFSLITHIDKSHYKAQKLCPIFSLSCPWFELLMSVRFRLPLHFKSYIVFQFLTKLPATWPINIPANVNFWHLALGEYSFWTHLHSCRRLQCLHEDAKVIWVCCTCPPALIGADLAWFAQSFCPVTIGCGPNQLTITAVLLVVFPPVNVSLTSVKWGKNKLKETKENYKIAIKWEAKKCFHSTITLLKGRLLSEEYLHWLLAQFGIIAITPLQSKPR